MPHRRTQLTTDERSYPTAVDTVTRTRQGQSLDDARETFRTEWQAKVDGKMRQAVRARLQANEHHQAVGLLLIVVALGGTLVSSLAFATRNKPSYLMEDMVLAGVIGLIAVITLLLINSGCAWGWGKRAERLERAAREMEHL